MTGALEMAAVRLSPPRAPSPKRLANTLATPNLPPLNAPVAELAAALLRCIAPVPYFGVITAAVDGPAAQEYRFTSALPIAVLKLLAPQLEQRLDGQFLEAR